MEFFDSHTHLDSPEFDMDREEVIKRAYDRGVHYILNVGSGYGSKSAEQAIRLAGQYDFIWASTGIHPHDAETDMDPEKLKEFAQHEKVVAVGETGLDFFKNWSPFDLQEKWFRIQIDIALAVNKPLIIHSREAGEKCISILKEYNISSIGGVFHCYPENAVFAEKLHEINFKVSFPGTLTFKKAEKVREAAREIPLEQILIETDAPYMAPVPHRGKRCESSFVADTAAMLAEVKNLPLEEVARATTRNAKELFRINI